MEFVVADITQPGVPAAIVHRCVEMLGSVDILVNSAGIALLSDVEEFGRDLWDPMVSVNLTAAFELAYEASKFMIEQRSGKIINIASLFSFLGGKRSPAYAATKAGIAGFTKAYCDELATYNIQVNAIAPGYFKTAITEATRADPDADRRIVEHIPGGPLGGDRRPDGGHRLPGQPGLGLRQRPCPGRRRRLSRPLIAVPKPQADPPEATQERGTDHGPIPISAEPPVDRRGDDRTARAPRRRDRR